MPSLRHRLARTLGHAVGRTPEPPCACRHTVTDAVLRVDADDCPGAGDLATEPACRATAVDALRTASASAVRATTHGLERRYDAASVALLRAAAEFAERVAHRDARLAERATRNPVAAAAEASERAGPAARLVAATGLLDHATGVTDAEAGLRAYVGPTLAAARVAAHPPPNARLVRTTDTAPDTAVRVYETPDQPVPTYHVDPPETDLTTAEYGVLDDAAAHLADAAGDAAHHAAVRAVAPDDAPVDRLARVLRKHTAGYGVLDDLFADPGVSDVFVNAPPDDTVLRVRVGGDPMRTNVTLTSEGAAALASRARAASGRAFSRAAPVLDAHASDVGGRDGVRVAGVTAPVTDGTAFAFRASRPDAWRLPDLVANETLPRDAASLLSLAVARGARVLVAGPRGAGKTTFLAALLWELPAAARVVLLEDTPELPVAALQAADRDALALRTDSMDAGATVTPEDALRAALRLGDGALVVGEVRGDEARVLYEAMRVGAAANAVLGTIHGHDAASVRERVVTDLGVPASSFEATDLVVTLARTPEGRRVVAVDEVTRDGFASLYETTDAGLAATGRVARGNSALVARLARPDETYADVRDALAGRTDRVAPPAGVPEA